MKFIKEFFKGIGFLLVMATTIAICTGLGILLSSIFLSGDLMICVGFLGGVIVYCGLLYAYTETYL